MKTADFDFELPPELIASFPPEKRTDSRLLCIDRATKTHAHYSFSEFPEFFGENDFLVFNQSKVIPARISWKGKEIFLAEQILKNTWKCLVRPGKKFGVGAEISFSDGTSARVLDIDKDGLREIAFSPQKSFEIFLEQFGKIPLPPYLRREADESDKTRYQTVYAEEKGSVAAPTAGLHFDADIFERLKNRGVETAFLTLHVGLGTFLPVKTERVEDHQMHPESFEISPETAEKINAARRAGKKITAIGSTSLRALESAFAEGEVQPGFRKTDIFLYPPAQFQVVDHFFTNFHLPKSTLLMLLSAFCSPRKTEGKELALEKYHVAIAERYRFFSYGDASLWL